MANCAPASLSRILERKTTLYFSRNAGEVFFRGKKLVVVTRNNVENEFAFEQIRRVVLLGNAKIATNILYRFMRKGIAVDWLDIFGRPIGQLLSLNEDMDKNSSGQSTFRDTSGALDLARIVLLAKFDNCHEAIRRKTKISAQWQERRKAIKEAKTAESLRGAEGYAAREYFALWHDILHDFEWTGRHPHPAPDPVNMLLSLGYGLLHNRLSSALRSAGLNPRIGFFHQNRGRHCALASDLMEPFRAIVDAAVLKLIAWNEIKPKQFIKKGERCACVDNAVFCKLLFAFEEMFSAEHTFYDSWPDHPAVKASVNDALDDAAESFAHHINFGSQCFVPRLTPCPAT